MQLYFKRHVDLVDPKVSGTYDTDMGPLFWNNDNKEWTELSEDGDIIAYWNPRFWYEKQIKEEPKKKQAGYFTRLKTHPGLTMATFMSIVCFVAASQNKAIHTFQGVVIVGGIGSAFFWMIVLLSNFGRK